MKRITLLALVLGMAAPALAQEVSECSTPDLPISSFILVTDEIEVEDTLVVGEIEITTEISHTWIGDLLISIEGPEGTSVDLYTGSGEDQEDIDVVWSANGASHGSDEFNCACSMQPDGDLDAFSGDLADGTWTLTVEDNFDLDDGTLDEWCLDVFESCPLTPPSEFECTVGSNAVDLTWENEGDYVDIVIFKDDEELETLDGNETDYTDEDPGVGRVEYRIEVVDAEDCVQTTNACEVDLAVEEICNDEAVDIPELVTGVESFIEVDDYESIDHLEVSVDISHSWIGDVGLDLETPEGTERVLYAGEGVTGVDMLVTFADGGTDPIIADYNCDCAVDPSDPDALDDLLEESVEGEWTLVAKDTFFIGTGTLNKWCLRFVGVSSDETFLRGDVDGGGSVSPLLDALHMLQYFFALGDEIPCLDAADADDNGSVSPFLDALFLIDWFFDDGAEPAAPGPYTCGDDPTEDDLECEELADTCL